MALNPRKRLWKEAVMSYILMWAHEIFGIGLGEPMTSQALDHFATEARSHKTARDRHAIWYESLRDLVVQEMVRQGISERRTAQGSTHYQLVPNLAMGKEENGVKGYYRLVEVYGQEWVDNYITVVETTIPEHTEVSYSLDKSELHTSELLDITSLLGNKPTFEVGPPTKRVKEDKSRNAHKRRE